VQVRSEVQRNMRETPEGIELAKQWAGQEPDEISQEYALYTLFVSLVRARLHLVISIDPAQNPKGFR
jgi:hypothetical protein